MPAHRAYGRGCRKMVPTSGLGGGRDGVNTGLSFQKYVALGIAATVVVAIADSAVKLLGEHCKSATTVLVTVSDEGVDFGKVYCERVRVYSNPKIALLSRDVCVSLP